MLHHPLLDEVKNFGVAQNHGSRKQDDWVKIALEAELCTSGGRRLCICDGDKLRRHFVLSKLHKCSGYHISDTVFELRASSRFCAMMAALRSIADGMTKAHANVAVT
jgi:hypothetical protein